MRRIFESDAVVRDDDDPHVPNEREDSGRSRAMIDWDAASHALMPVGLRDRAVAVAVETDRSQYEPGEPVGVRVRMHNRLPVPVALRTTSPVLWTWAVDGAVEASRAPPEYPDRAGLLRFARSERKTFHRRWPQRIRTEAGRWRPVDPGEYTIAAWITVEDADERSLRAETTVEIR